MGKGKTSLASPVGPVNSENQNNNRSRGFIPDRTDEVETLGQLLVRIQWMIEEGNAKLERKIESSNLALVAEIATLRDEMNQLKDDYARELNDLRELHAKTVEEVRRNKDVATKLLKSNDLILSGVPYLPNEKTDVPTCMLHGPSLAHPKKYYALLTSSKPRVFGLPPTSTRMNYQMLPKNKEFGSLKHQRSEPYK